jgi:hypothetical protein
VFIRRSGDNSWQSGFTLRNVVGSFAVGLCTNSDQRCSVIVARSLSANHITNTVTYIFGPWTPATAAPRWRGSCQMGFSRHQRTSSLRCKINRLRHRIGSEDTSLYFRIGVLSDEEKLSRPDSGLILPRLAIGERTGPGGGLHACSVSRTRSAITAGPSSIANITGRPKPCGRRDEHSETAIERIGGDLRFERRAGRSATS